MGVYRFAMLEMAFNEHCLYLAEYKVFTIMVESHLERRTILQPLLSV